MCEVSRKQPDLRVGRLHLGLRACDGSMVDRDLPIDLARIWHGHGRGAVWNHGPVEIRTELQRLVGSLADGESVYGRVAPGDVGAVAEEVHRLAAEAQQAWARYAVKGALGPDSPAETADALRETTSQRAVELMTYLSVDDLVFLGQGRRDRARALRAAERLVKLLGYDSQWWTNIDDLSADVRAWTPVTRQTFDGVIAGAGNGLVVALLQVGED